MRKMWKEGISLLNDSSMLLSEISFHHHELPTMQLNLKLRLQQMLQLPSESKSVSTSSAAEEEDILDDDANITSPSTPSSPSVIIDEDISDEPFSAEEDFDEEEEMSDYISDDSNDFNPRNKRLRLNRSDRSSSQIITRGCGAYETSSQGAEKSCCCVWSGEFRG